MEEQKKTDMGHNHSRSLRNGAMTPLINKRYQFVKTLSSDSWGGTYLVANIKMTGHPLCVIKQLKLPINHPGSLEFSLNLLKKKAETLKSIGESPQIPHILSYFEEQKSFYVVEEYIAGNSLAEEIIPGKILPEPQVIALIKEIVKALVVIHNHGIIHHRLKPSKLIRRKSDNCLCLTGFGIFREISSKMLQSQGQKTKAETNGSRIYVPPEQSVGQAQFNSDLYAIGIIGIQALTGGTAADLLKRRPINEDLSGSLAWNNQVQVSPWLVKLLNKMVHQDSKQRYQLAKEVLEDIDVGEGNNLHRRASQPLTTLQTPEKISPIVTASSLSPPLPQVDSIPEPSPPSQKAIAPSNQGGFPKSWIIAGGAITGLLLLLILGRIPQRLMSSYQINRGVQEEETGTTQEALKHYNQAISLHPKNAKAYYQRGLIQKRLGNHEEALEDLTTAIIFNSQSVEAHYQRGNIRRFLGDNGGAIADYTQALAIDSNYTKAYINRGGILADEGDEKLAIEDYTQAIRLHQEFGDNDTLGSAFLNRCLSRSNIGDQDGAITDCTEAINLQPTHSFAYQNRGMARGRKGDLEGAIADYNTAIKLAPDDPEPYYNRGLARLDLKDPKGAIIDFTKALELNKDHVLVYYDRAIAYAQIDELDQAIADLEQSVTLCVSVGRLQCVKDSQYQLQQLKQPQ